MYGLYLCAGYRDGRLEYSPDDDFIAGRGGEGALVSEVVMCVIREQILNGEGFDVSLRICTFK